MSGARIAAGSLFPAMSWPTVDGGTLDPSRQTGWRMLVVYRGRHCPLCKRYFKSLDTLLPEYQAAEISVAAVSADPYEKARADVEAEGWRFPVGYGLSIEQMRTLGLYVSTPRSEQETDRPFAEPAVLVVNPEGCVQIVDVSNAPFARPDLGALLAGVKFVREKNYPVRGTLS